MPEKNYTYFDFTLSLCPECLKRVDAKILFEDGKVWMHKRCHTHGSFKVLIATDIDYYKKARLYAKPSEAPLKTNTESHYGCPYDCGLCPDHEQHSCLTVVEITDRCNLTCPTCYALSSPHYGRHRTVEEVEQMLDTIVANEGRPDVVQLSGGEPTLHPEFFRILDITKTKPIRHLMVNTNGVRIAKDREFVKRLAGYQPNFEVYLQFDSFRPEVLQHMRGQDLTDIRKRALEHLNEFNLSTTLVVTLQKGQNEDEIGPIIDYALKQPCVRGVTFQPTQVAGRLEGFDPEKDRITLTEVRQQILNQYPLFKHGDIIPVPCNPDALAMAYVLKMDGQVYPLTNLIDPDFLITQGRNTIVYEQDQDLHRHILQLFSTGNSVEVAEEHLHELLCCIPPISAPGLSYQNLFRIIIMRFIDAWDFDVRAIKKSCVHIVNKDNKIIPFETMNMFYRDDKVQRLEELRTLYPV